jgi:phosphomethylpyrimidine synthase
MTQLLKARKGDITPEMIQVAESEGLEPEQIMELVARGHAVIPKNRSRSFKAVGIGRGLRTKVNANIGTSPKRADPGEELEKLSAAVQAGADAVMDLSTGGDLDSIRNTIIQASPLMVGTVPIYQAAAGEDFMKMETEDIFEMIARHAASGVDFVTVHCGVTREVLPLVLDESERVMGVVSRGGGLLLAWMQRHGRENPLYEHYDRLLDIALEHDVTLSLGDGLRPGSVLDATDALQMSELYTLGRLARRAYERGVQVMIEGPGHVPLDQIAMNVKLEKQICRGAPFYVLGPLTTDIAPGYDHITSAIGGAVAAAAGVDFLCYVTPAEHLRLPTSLDVRMGVIAARIAAHSGDIVKGVKGALEKDRLMSEARKRLDWERMYALAIDPACARRFREESESYGEEVCTMCGNFCPINISNLLRKEKGSEPPP